MKYYVYSHMQADTGEVFYIGKGMNNRAYSKYRRSSWWKNIANKHDWKVIIIKDSLSEEEAFELEKFYIKEYGRRDLGTGTLINLTDGGDGISNISSSTRKKMSDSKKGTKRSYESNRKTSMSLKGKPSGREGKVVSEEGRNNISEGLRGHFVSEETRKKLSDKLKGRVFSEETRKKMSESRKGKKRITYHKIVNDE